MNVIKALKMIKKLEKMQEEVAKTGPVTGNLFRDQRVIKAQEEVFNKLKEAEGALGDYIEEFIRARQGFWELVGHRVEGEPEAIAVGRLWIIRVHEMTENYIIAEISDPDTGRVRGTYKIPTF